MNLYTQFVKEKKKRNNAHKVSEVQLKIILEETNIILIQCIFLKPLDLTKKKGLVRILYKKGHFWLFAFALEYELPYF